VSQRRALITGITGQDGSYLAELLLDKGYDVHGLVRRTSTEGAGRLRHIEDRLTLHLGDVLHDRSLLNAIRAAEPDEIYNLAAMSFVGASWTVPTFTTDVTGGGVARVLEAIRDVRPEARFYQASSSEMFGGSVETPQRETTPFQPRSPYAIAKLSGHHLTVNFRESFGMWACSGILFNHESPRRGPEFVTRRVTHAAAAIRLGLQDELRLGNLDARRDWGYAPEYVAMMWRMLQQDEPDDFVIGTGETHSVRDLVEIAFDQAGLEPDQYVRVDPDLMRPTDVGELRADPSKAAEQLDWRPQTGFEAMVRLMVDADLKLLEAGLAAEGGAVSEARPGGSP
jgi:GDPmannose 4,6-dehydratase